MPPSEDAQLLLRIVQRHLRTLEFGLDERFPAEDWGFTALTWPPEVSPG